MGDYIDNDDLYERWGRTRVRRWAQREPDNATDPDDLLTRAIENGEAYVADRLRNGPYAIPVSGPPTTLKFIMATVAGWWLYQGVAAAPDDPERQEVAMQKAESDELLDKFLSSVLRWDSDRSHDHGNAPAVIE